MELVPSRRTLIKFAYFGNGNELGSGNFFSPGLIYFRPFMRHKGCISSNWFAIFIQFLSWCCHCRKQTELLKNKSPLKIEHWNYSGHKSNIHLTQKSSLFGFKIDFLSKSFDLEALIHARSSILVIQ